MPPAGKSDKQRQRLAAAKQRVYARRAEQHRTVLPAEAARFTVAAAAAPAFMEGELTSRSALALSVLYDLAEREARAAVAALVAEPADASTLAAAEALRAQLRAGRPWLASRGVGVAVLTGADAVEAARWSTAAFSATRSGDAVLAFGNRIVLVFSRLVELSRSAAQRQHVLDDVFAKDALCSELLAGAGVDIPAGQHVLLLVAIPGRGGRMDPRGGAVEGGVVGDGAAAADLAGGASARCGGGGGGASSSTSSSISSSSSSSSAAATSAALPFPCCAPSRSRRSAPAPAPPAPRERLRAHVSGPVCPLHNDAALCETQVLAWAAASKRLGVSERPRYIVVALKMSGARCGFVQRIAAAHRALAASASATCRDLQRGSANHDGLMMYEGTYVPRNESGVHRFSTAAGCELTLLRAHARVRAELAARLALFERALFQAGAAVRDACAARGSGDARYLEPGLARRGVHFSAFCFSENMNNRMHVDAGRANEVIVQCARDPHGRPRSWTFVCAAVGASFRLEGGDAEFGALTIQPSFVFHGTPLVTGAAAAAANAAAGLLGVAGFAKVAVLSARLEGGSGDAARPRAAGGDADDDEAAEGEGEEEMEGAAEGRAPARGVKRSRDGRR
jgi:hypothetical protein